MWGCQQGWLLAGAPRLKRGNFLSKRFKVVARRCAVRSFVRSFVYSCTLTDLMAIEGVRCLFGFIASPRQWTGGAKCGFWTRVLSWWRPDVVWLHWRELGNCWYVAPTTVNLREKTHRTHRRILVCDNPQILVLVRQPTIQSLNPVKMRETLKNMVIITIG